METVRARARDWNFMFVEYLVNERFEKSSLGISSSAAPGRLRSMMEVEDVINSSKGEGGWVERIYGRNNESYL